MKTLILPGYSIKNKDWAEETKKELEPNIQTVITYWDHWETGTSETNWIKKEVQKILNNNPEPVNILAKSIGTVVTMIILKLNPNIINKIILCGIPINDLQEEDKECYQVLKYASEEDIICFQNENDNHGSYQQITSFLNKINPRIKIISKPRSDHEYPYSDDFTKYLTPKS